MTRYSLHTHTNMYVYTLAPPSPPPVHRHLYTVADAALPLGKTQCARTRWPKSSMCPEQFIYCVRVAAGVGRSGKHNEPPQIHTHTHIHTILVVPFRHRSFFSPPGMVSFWRRQRGWSAHQRNVPRNWRVRYRVGRGRIRTDFAKTSVTNRAGSHPRPRTY